MSCYRRTTGNYFNNPFDKPVLCDSDMLAQYPLISPENIIRVARIMLYIRVAAKAPDALKLLVDDLEGVADSWTWLVRSCAKISNT